MTTLTANKPKERCPHLKSSPVAYDFKRDKVYEGVIMCSLNDKPCLLELGYPCETYEEYLKELADEQG